MSVGSTTSVTHRSKLFVLRAWQAGLLSLAVVSTSWATDVAGSSDLAVLPRLPQAQIIDYRQSLLQNRELPQGKVRRLSGQLSVERSVTLSGEATALTYALAPSQGSIEGFNQSLKQLYEQNATLLYRCEGRDCGSSNLWANNIFANARLYGVDDQQAYALVRLAEPDDNSLLALYAITRGNRRAYLHVEQVQTDAPLTQLLPEASSVLYQLRQLGTLSLTPLKGEPQADWLEVLSLSLRRDATLRIALAGPDAAQWRDALVAQGVPAARLELDAETVEGLRLSRIR